MNIHWEITTGDIDHVRAFVASRKDDAFLQVRRQRNIDPPRIEVAKEHIWMVMVGCLLTTRQRSGRGSAVNMFMSLNPFPLKYSVCIEQPSFDEFATHVLTDFGGLRRGPTVGEELRVNLSRLQSGEWERILRFATIANKAFDPQQERVAAHYIDDTFKGFGPKQSRNLLQWLGVSRFEIPIDSRITKWLNRYLFNFKLNASMLSDRTYYDFVSDGIIRLCEKADIYPCILDAAIFSSFDKGVWDDSELASEKLLGA